MTTKTDVPAFPIPLSPGQSWNGMEPPDGMTLRDYFAAKAMQELARSFYANDDSDNFKVALRAMCNESYQWADAMIKARESP